MARQRHGTPRPGDRDGHRGRHPADVYDFTVPLPASEESHGSRLAPAGAIIRLAPGRPVLAVLSSVAGERARRSNFIYGSSKAGLDSFFEGLGDSLVGSGARVLLVRPGFVRTRMTAGMDAAPFAVEPEDVAAVIVRALETGAEAAWAPPRLRWVMAAVRHLPRPLFRKLRV